jgi:hypothetical protein
MNLCMTHEDACMVQKYKCMSVVKRPSSLNRGLLCLGE